MDNPPVQDSSIIDFGRTAIDYAQHRQGFPDQWFDTLFQKKVIKVADGILDLGTGTGSIVRGFTLRGVLLLV